MINKIKHALAVIAGICTLILLMGIDSLNTKSLGVIAGFALVAFILNAGRQAPIRKSPAPLGDRIALKYSADLRETIRKIDEGR